MGTTVIDPEFLPAPLAKRKPGRPALCDVPGTNAWFGATYGIGPKRAQSLGVLRQRWPSVKPEARAFIVALAKKGQP